MAMSAPPSSSNIRVFVAFKEDSVFAGDRIEATITFKNINSQPRPQSNNNAAHSRNPPAPAQRRPSTTSFLPSRGTHSRQPSLNSQTTKGPTTSPRSPSFGHRQALSLNMLDAGKTDRNTAARSSAAKSASHSRSVSILSFGSDTEKPKKGRLASMHRDPTRPTLKLTRSTSVQVTSASPRPPWQTSPNPGRPYPSPLSTAISPPPESGNTLSPTVAYADSPKFANGSGSFRSPKLPQQRNPSTKGSPFPPSSFKFPAPAEFSPDSPDGLSRSPGSSTVPTPVRPDFLQSYTEPSLGMLEPKFPGHERKTSSVNRVLSLSSDHGTPRSSMDHTDVSSSNLSDDTTTSETIRGPISRFLGKPNFFRQPSQLGATARQRFPETLMMGFVQVYGSFTVDGSLVNQGPFEEVKRRAVVGGQGGGGVVGIERPKNDGKFFGGFSWGNIGESLGGILGGNEPSSMREMKGKAQSKSVPLLSTPKSILFVDLKLAPGESRSYSYTFPLPRGLPPSHKGRAMKIAYQLVIGTQRVGSGKAAREQQIRHVEVPFRVFGGVDSQGNSFSHDLMSPYIVLKDEAQTSMVVKPSVPNKTLAEKQGEAQRQIQSSEADFNSYIHHLLNNPNRGSTAGVLSPVNDTEPLTPSITNGSIHSQLWQNLAMNPRTLVDNAIRTSMQPAGFSSGPQGPNSATSRTNFTIARSGQPIANLILSRPALRLGDLLHVTLDFGAASAGRQQAPALVHAMTLTLESSESIDPALAIRSAASVERVTRRIWDRRIVGGANAAALAWCTKWSGSLKIPANATPGFASSGVACAWVVRVEIGVGATLKLQDEFQEEDEDDLDDYSEDARGSDSIPRLRYDVGDGSEVSSEADRREKPSPQKSPKVNRGGQQRRTRGDVLLEDVSNDERGLTAAAVRQIACETFEIAVPIRVFGAPGATDSVVAEEHEVDGLSI